MSSRLVPPLLAHAFGVRYDLPLPLWMFVLGGAVVVLVSFAAVAGRPVTAHEGTIADAAAGGGSVGAGPAPAGPAAALVGAAAVAFLGFLVWVGLTGSQEVPENLLPTWFWIVVWVVIPLSCGTLGDWTGPVNPYGWLARWADRVALRRVLLGDAAPLRYPSWLGWWPAAVLYFAAVCGELVFNRAMTAPRNLALALLLYALLSLAGGLLFGRPWLRHGEVFSVLYATWGRLGWFRFGAAGRRGFAGGFDVAFQPVLSRVAFVLLLLVSVNFDGLLATPRWDRFERSLPGDIDQLHPAHLDAFRTVTFLVLAVVLGAVFAAFATGAAAAAGHRPGARSALAGLLPSIVPIAFGYLLAHYLQYVLVNGQLLAPLAGNPTGRESWPLHLPYPFNDDYEVRLRFLPTGFYWYFAVAVIVAAHIVAVVIAHAHLATRAAEPAAARRSEYPWLAAMVGYTMVSLWLLAQPLVKQDSGQAAAAAARAPVAGPVANASETGPSG